MSAFRGILGALSRGGAITGSPLVKGATANGLSAATFDGASLNGIIRPGDTFTVAGDAQLYTVSTAGVIGASVANERSLTFTPTVQQAGGWADNAAVSYVSNSMAEITAWEATPSRAAIDVTTIGDSAGKVTLGVPRWSGRATAFLDYGDADQAALIDQIKANTEPSTVALTLVVADGKHLWGDVMMMDANITGDQGDTIVEVVFDFMGDGAVSPNWNAAA